MEKDQAKHVILGAGGAIGNNLVEVFKEHNTKIRAVSRHHTDIGGAENHQADLLEYNSVLNAVTEGSTVFLLAGLQYDSRIWEKQWPIIMDNVLDACTEKKANLIFFDNVYMYGKVDGPMKESTPVAPRSKKGKVRAAIALKLMQAVERGHLNAMIARSADFYGPHATFTSLPFTFIINKMARGKAAQWLGNAKAKHVFTYTQDAAKALYLLSQKAEHYNQVWHLPSVLEPTSAEELIDIASKLFDMAPEYRTINKLLVFFGGFMDRMVKETFEMLYQVEYDYLFDSSKFLKAFDFTPTSYKEGMRTTAKMYFPQLFPD